MFSTLKNFYVKTWAVIATTVLVYVHWLVLTWFVNSFPSLIAFVNVKIAYLMATFKISTVIDKWTGKSVSLAIMFLLVLIALTPLYNILYRFKGKSLKHYPRFARLYSEVCFAAGYDQKDFVVRVVVCNELNAYIARNVMVLYTSLLNHSDEVIKGVIAHEIGHFHNKDSVLTAVVDMAYRPTYILTKMMSIAASILAVFCKLPLVGLVFLVFNWYFVFMTYLIKFLLCIPEMIGAYSSRHCEFRADEFAANCGYTHGIIEFLTFCGNEHIPFWNIAKKLNATHPSPRVRIKKLAGRSLY